MSTAGCYLNLAVFLQRLRPHVRECSVSAHASVCVRMCACDVCVCMPTVCGCVRAVYVCVFVSCGLLGTCALDQVCSNSSDRSAII